MISLHTIGMLLYPLPLLAIWWLYVRRRRAAHEVSAAVFEDNVEAGLMSSVSLHPVIDPKLCIGCGSCISACPEMPTHQVLGMLRRKAELISPTDCIGHGACKSACPVDAISLVFGTEERGVDIPNVNSDFETNVEGIFIAGELGGMGLIRNAIEQGRQALVAISRRVASLPRSADHQVIIVGAGPSGISASLAAKELGLDYITLEQDSLGGTVACFPRRKIVMTEPAELPIVGKVRFRETTKEALIDFWQGVADEAQLRIRYGERVETVSPTPSGFEVTTTAASYRGQAILLAIGRRGTPRKLGVPGEESTKVTYRLIDAEQYSGMKVLVVGGGDSALESALSISEQEGAEVTLSYRSAVFSRVRRGNRRALEEAAASGAIRLLLESTVSEIGQGYVELMQGDRKLRIDNDAVIINAGGILPTQFLSTIGIETQTKFGTA